MKSGAFEEGQTEDILRPVEGCGLVRATITENSPFVFGIEGERNWISAPSSNEFAQEGEKLVICGPLGVLRTHFRFWQASG